MSPASKSKSKGKMANKKAQNSFAKSLGSSNAVAGRPTNACTPLSNNGSWSAESEDNKKKATNPLAQQEVVPKADNDKQEKIHHKNEIIYERYNERWAQNLHDLCCGYLISRKLDTIAQKLVAMGFPYESATTALLLNEGKVEESVAWLLEGAEESKKLDIGRGDLKIDISEELACIVDLETKYKCSKHEVERAVIGCEGDLDKAIDNLRELKLDPLSNQPKLEENSDPPSMNNSMQSRDASQSSGLQAKPLLSPNQPKKDENNFNCTKATFMARGLPKTSSRDVQPPNIMSPMSERVKQQEVSTQGGKKLLNVGSNPSISNSLASPLQVSPTPAKSETSNMSIRGDYKNLQPRTTMNTMHRPQTAATRSSYPRRVSTSWYPTNTVHVMSPNNVLSYSPNARNPGLNPVGSNQLYQRLQYQQPQQHFLVGNNSLDLQVTNRGNNIWNSTSSSSTLVSGTSKELFSGLGSVATSSTTSPIIWSTDGSMHFDYTNINWSLDRGISPSRSNELCLGISPFTKSTAQLYDTKASGVAAQPSMRSLPSNGSISPWPGLQDCGVSSTMTSTHSRK